MHKLTIKIKKLMIIMFEKSILEQSTKVVYFRIISEIDKYGAGRAERSFRIELSYRVDRYITF